MLTVQHFVSNKIGMGMRLLFLSKPCFDNTYSWYRIHIVVKGTSNFNILLWDYLSLPQDSWHGIIILAIMQQRRGLGMRPLFAQLSKYTLPLQQSILEAHALTITSTLLTHSSVDNGVHNKGVSVTNWYHLLSTGASQFPQTATESQWSSYA